MLVYFIEIKSSQHFSVEKTFKAGTNVFFTDYLKTLMKYLHLDNIKIVAFGFYWHIVEDTRWVCNKSGNNGFSPAIKRSTCHNSCTHFNLFQKSWCWEAEAVMLLYVYVHVFYSIYMACFTLKRIPLQCPESFL